MNPDHFTVYDIESYPNYFLALFQNPDGSITSFDESQLKELSKFIRDKRLVGFNNHHYDDPLLFAICIRDVTNASEAWELTQKLIEGPKDSGYGANGSYQWKLQNNGWCAQSIDLKRALFKQGDSLKKLEAAYHFENLEDLPFPPGTVLTDQQKQVVTAYCENDVNATHRLLELRFNDLKLKQLLTDRYDVDVRSSGNASSAESIVRGLYIEARAQLGDAPNIWQLKEYSQVYNDDLQKNGVSDFIPEPVHRFLTFNNPRMQQVYEALQKTQVPMHDGRLDRNTITHHLDEYGISFSITAGGFHSEDTVCIDEGNLYDYDATSFYPSIMVSYGVQPSTYGPEFLEVFSELIKQRIKAKAAGDKTTADALKIVINSVYGKLNDQFSTFRDPRAMLMVTVTGQLLLIKLIEMMHEAGITVLSANTDGVMVQTEELELAEAVKGEWETLTGLNLERTDYSKVVRKSVNDYIAVSTNGNIKRKGSTFAVSGVAFPTPPSNDIVKDAMVDYFICGTDPAVTINESTDIRKFIATYSSTGKMQTMVDGQRVQKSNRWYHAEDSSTEIKRQRLDGTGLTLVDSGIRICNKLPKGIPDDLDRQWYIDKAQTQIDEVEMKSAPPGENAHRAAELAQLEMSVIPMNGARNATGTRYDGSKRWENWEYDNHPNGGFLNGDANGLFTITITNPDKIPDELTALVNDNPTLVICSDAIHPDDVSLGKATGAIVYRSNNIDLIPSMSRPKKHGFTVKGGRSSTVCFGPTEDGDHHYIINGTINSSLELEEWLISI